MQSNFLIGVWFRSMNEFEREEEMLRHVHDLHCRLRETAAQELTVILRERIRYTIEYEATTDPLNVPPDMSDLSGPKQKRLAKSSCV